MNPQPVVPRHKKTPRSGREAAQVAAEQRRIQRQVARSDRQHPAKEFQGSMQAGARAYPEPPLPAQHKSKPGLESQIRPAADV